MIQLPGRVLSMRDAVPMHSTFAGDATSRTLGEPWSVQMKWGENLSHRRIDFVRRAPPNRRLYVNTPLSTGRIMSGNAGIAATRPALCAMETSTFAVGAMIEIRGVHSMEARDLGRQY